MKTTTEMLLTTPLLDRLVISSFKVANRPLKHKLNFNQPQKRVSKLPFLSLAKR